MAREQGKAMEEMSLTELDKLWDRAKRGETPSLT
jgi:uncharacterized protein YabN with tetrapyrrole methylase and pyrophosphatase domain